jgi:DNA-binding transcriptional MerR regulator
MSNYITAGELAKLASTTKRTIHFYDEKGVLKPKKINSKKYRFYEDQQVLDYQMILLLSTLGVPLDEIKSYLKRNGKLPELFNTKKLLVQEQINELQFNLNNLNKFLANLKINGTMVNPQIKTLLPFGVYYIEKVGSYAKIGNYCEELLEMFEQKSSDFTTLAIFEDPTYQPKQSRIKVGVLAKKHYKVKAQCKDVVKLLKFNPGKVITYTHNGSGSLLSLFWKELEKFCKLNKIKVRKGVPDFEIYRKVNDDVTKQLFEIYIPIL